MEEEKEVEYTVIVTNSADRYFYQLMDYFHLVYPPERADEVGDEVRETAQSLSTLAHRGASEPQLTHLKEGFKFILYQRVTNADVKVIYFIDDARNIVYVTDFFPTEKDPVEIVSRNS